jgi:hypothetical protein
MSKGRIAVTLTLAAIVGIGGWQGLEALNDAHAASPTDAAAAPSPTPAATSSPDASGVVTIDVPSESDVERGATPMAQRVAVLALLNKRNGKSQDLTLRPGQAVRIGDAVIRLRACEETAPWEQDHYTGAFVQLDVHQFDKSWQRVFSGWLFKERPELNVVQNPIYDVWTKSCKMSRPDTGPDTVAAASVQRSVSSAKKSAPSSSSAAAAATPDADAPATAVPDAAVAPTAKPSPSATPNAAR